MYHEICRITKEIREFFFKSNYETFQDFPNGFCKIASLVLHHKLKKDIGLLSVCHCGWDKEDENSHSWLETKSYIIDCTIDQIIKSETNQFVFKKNDYPLKDRFIRNVGIVNPDDIRKGSPYDFALNNFV